MIDDKRIYFSMTAIFILLILIAYGYFFVTDNLSLKSFLPESEKIRLDEDKTVRLDSGWEVYTDEDKELKISTDVKPGVFRTGNYYYRLNIDTEGMQGSNAFLVNPIHSAYRLWVNGELLSQSGVPGAEQESLSFLRNTVVPYDQKDDSLEIILQVSNHSHLFGGSMINWINYGRFQDISLRQQQGRLLDFLIVLGLLVIALIHVFSYYYQKKYTYTLFFFLFAAAYALIALFTGRVTASTLMPMLNAGHIFRIEAILVIISFPFLMGYIHALFPDEVNKNIVRIFQIAVIPVAAAVVFLPFEYIRQILRYYDVVRIAGSVYLLFMMYRAAQAGRNGARLTMASFAVLVLCMIHDGLFASAVIQSERLVFVGLYIFAVHQTYRLVTDSIADNKKAADTNNRLNLLLQQKENFFSRNSTELDKPIRNIVELGESLLRGSIGTLNSEQIATSSLIVSNGIRLSNMIGDILDFTNIRENTVKLKLGPVDLFKISRKVLNSCEALVSVSKVKLNSEIEREIPLISADERRMEHIFYNIFSNSIRHIRSGEVAVMAEEVDEDVRITISIKGSDLDEQRARDMFTAYEPDENENIDEKDIADLSLSIAGKLVELHGSMITVESEEDCLKYIFAMPKWIGEMTEEEILEMDALINLQPVLDEIASDRDIEILVAGKDIEELQIFKSQLASMNYSVIPMLSGADLLVRMKEQPPHLVIMDVKLPDMSGYEVCSEIRTLYSKEELPVLLVINKEDVSEMMEGLTSGANDFLTRPYIQEEFLTRVNTHLQLSRISTVYSRFVPTEFLNSLGQENIVDVTLGDQVQREMTILFVDIRAFTNLSENMTPEENFKFINSYLSRFSPMITNNGGFVDKYIGDAIMALFPDRPESAIAAAKEMIDHVNVYNGHRANCGYRPINIGVGIHTGSMILGIIGDEKRMQGTVISDAVNLASRIQDVTKLYKANIVISQETFVKLENPMDYNFRFLGRVKVKGKDKAVALFEIFDSDIEEKRENKNKTKADFEDAIMKFSRREFAGAKDLLERVISEDPDDMTARIFIDRIDQMLLAEKKNFLTSL